MAKKRKVKRLLDLDALEVSLVPTGANNRTFLVTKENGEDDVEEIIKQILEGKLENEAEIDEILKQDDKLSPDQRKTIKGAVRLLSSVSGVIPDGIMKQLRDMAGTSEGEKENKKETKKDGEDDEAESTEDPKAANKEGDMEPSEIRKALEQNQEVIKSLKTENEKLQDEIKKERDARVLKEFEQKAEELSHLGKPKAEVAKMLKEASEKMSEESYNLYVETLKESNDKLAKSTIFKSLGSDAGDDAGITGKIEAKKAEIMKADANLTAEAAEERVLMENPDLYNEYLDEHPKQGGR